MFDNGYESCNIDGEEYKNSQIFKLFKNNNDIINEVETLCFFDNETKKLLDPSLRSFTGEYLVLVFENKVFKIKLSDITAKKY